MTTDDANVTTTRLLTLLNVSAVKNGKRKWLYEEMKPVKLNKRKVTVVAEAMAIDEPVVGEGNTMTIDTVVPLGATGKMEEKDDDDHGTSAYELHFGAQNNYLDDKSRKSVDENAWTTTREKWEKFGTAVQRIPEGGKSMTFSETTSMTEKLTRQLKTSQEKLPRDLKTLQDTLLNEMLSYKDLYLPRITPDSHAQVRDIMTLHMLNHIFKKRRRITKNNDKILHSKDAEADVSVNYQDQGFTRPSVLVLLPFRSWALRWVNSLIGHTPKPEYQIENHARFLLEYGLPEGAVDKLQSSPAGTYPRDHVEMFQGNVDDSFRLGIKFTKKSVKLFADFYQSDLIIASPLGLRMSIEKEKKPDFLSSIEVLALDQMNALAMQNWEHLQFVLSNINILPKETRDADFSRIKPWYLEGHASYLRQTILLSPFDTPEFRNLFNSGLKNVSGKKRLESPYLPIQVPDGVSQDYVKFDCSGLKDEPDRRFEYFTQKLLPTVLKSAVQSANAMIFVPSSFDFIRVENYLRKHDGITFAVLSEYSSNQDIARARQAFFANKLSFLLISERFHFFKRYKIRGIRNLLFYGLPDHAQFYTELLSYPFLDDGVESSDITCRALYCKYDWMKLERIAGTEGATELLRKLS